MKYLTIFLLALLMIAPAAFARNRHIHYSYDHHSNFLDGVDLDIQRSTIVLTNDEYDDDIVEITRDYELYVNDQRVDLDPKEAELVQEFYDRTFELVDSAKEVGLEGADRQGLALDPSLPQEQ